MPTREGKIVSMHPDGMYVSRPDPKMDAKLLGSLISNIINEDPEQVTHFMKLARIMKLLKDNDLYIPPK
jgi:hypothetical protein